MDSNLTLVEVLIVASILVPLILLIKVGNNNKRKLRKQFNALADTYGLTITEKEFWGNANIGIDATKHKLLFLRIEEESFEECLIDLKTIEECKINTSIKRVNTKQKKVNILEKVDLKIYVTGSEPTIKALNFYDQNRMFSENFEVQRAEKWKKLIQD